MGVCQSGEDTRETEKNMQINKQLEREKAIQEYKILLLGIYVQKCGSPSFFTLFTKKNSMNIHYT